MRETRASCSATIMRWMLLGVLFYWSAPGQAALHHELQVRLSPQRHYLEVQDTLRWDADPPLSLVFHLHPGLDPQVLSADVQLIPEPKGEVTGLPALNVATGPAESAAQRYRLALPAGTREVTLRYRGTLHHGLTQQGEEYARGFQETPGTINPEGVFLSASSLWYPHFDHQRVTFSLELALPAGWSGMTQGERLERREGNDGVEERWRCDAPQEEIYLIAGRFTEYRQAADGVEAMVLLREADPALAGKYLQATGDYIRLYSELIGPYPYTKFALVENFWETGYGMPSFTLLGPRVIRFPFILHSSYPHEILHNWWGNGVYVDYESGNWAEGLTSYLADHLIKEQRGQGAEYRRNTLQKYTDHVRDRQDFPLTAFRSRHSARSEAVGYGKTLMLFHMLRQRLGDKAFVQGLRTLYDTQRFQVADFDDVEQAFSVAGGQSLEGFFHQWVERTGAPRLRLSQARARPAETGYVLSATLEQTQAGAPYALSIPIAVHLEGEPRAFQTRVPMEERVARLELSVPGRPLLLEVDPEFDLFRRLDRAEIPPAISQATGAERVLLVLPDAAPSGLRAGYAELAQTWRAGRPEKFEIRGDSTLQTLPTDRTVWLFGWRNRFRPRMAQALSPYAFEDQGEWVRIGEDELKPAEHALVVLARPPGHPEQALGWLAADRVEALPGLGRKLPHYGRYSYLAFTGPEPENVLKGQWPVVDSPLALPVVQADGHQVAPTRGELAPRSALAEPPARFSRERMLQDLSVLADPALAGRGLGSEGLETAARHIARAFQAAGLAPGGDGEGDYTQRWRAEVPGLGEVALTNVVGLVPGTDPSLAGQSLVIGAHYDHLGLGGAQARAADRGRIHPGADDNASGVAVLLELARMLGQAPQPRTLVFAAFTGEEWQRLGSRHFVQQAGETAPGDVTAMLNLDTVGRLEDRPLLVLGSGTAEEWVHIFRGAGYVTGVPVQAVPGDFGSSDQTSFIEAGVPAVQLFSGAHEDFHRPGDTLEGIDGAGLVKVANVVFEAVTYLAERREPLQARIAAGGAPVPDSGGRRVSLGTVPDFAYPGPHVRLEAVRPGTPAAEAGLQAGDLVLEVNGTAIQDLRDYGQALRALAPGDEIRLRYRRDGKEGTLSTRVVQR